MIFLDDIRRPFRNGVDRGLRVSPRNNGYNARIDDTQVLRSVHDQARIDHAADLPRHHGTRAGRVPVRDAAGAQEGFCLVQVLDAGRATPATRFDKRRQRCGFGDGFQILQVTREELNVERVREILGVDRWFTGGIAGIDMHAAVGKWVQ